jgi:hypothetical protein
MVTLIKIIKIRTSEWKTTKEMKQTPNIQGCDAQTAHEAAWRSPYREASAGNDLKNKKQ